MALISGTQRTGVKLLQSQGVGYLSKAVSRGIHSTEAKRMGGGHAHAHDEPYYLHAKHMYNLDRMKHQKLKMTLAVVGVVAIGVGVPMYCVAFQQRKTASS